MHCVDCTRTDSLLQAANYGIDLLNNSCIYVKEAVWRVFAGTVTL